MADEHATAKDAKYVLVCLCPDVCWTPIGKDKVPIPYTITHNMGESAQCSKNVFFNDKAAFLHGKSFVDNVTGDEPGTSGGVITGVNTKISHSLMHSASVFINGQPMVRTGDLVHMNTKKP